METIQIKTPDGELVDAILEEQLDNGDLIVRYEDYTMTLRQTKQVIN